jgi:hypothetical protein
MDTIRDAQAATSSGLASATLCIFGVKGLIEMQKIIKSVSFWFFFSLYLAGMTLLNPEGTAPLWLVCTMLASANFGAKCVRAELRADGEQAP